MIFNILSYESLKQTSHRFFGQKHSKILPFWHLIGPIVLPGNCSSNFQGRHRLEAIGFESWKKFPKGVTENTVAEICLCVFGSF